MRTKSKHITALLCGVAAGGFMWAVFSPASPPQAEGELAVQPSHGRWSVEKINGLISAIDHAEGTEELLTSIGRLNAIPSDQIEQALDLSSTTGVDLQQGSGDMKPSAGLSFSTLALLARWGEANGEAAADWAWRRYGPSGIWTSSFMAFGPGWAWKDPVAAVAWAKAHMYTEGGGSSSISWDSPPENIREAHEPVIDSQMLLVLRGWIIKQKPRLAYEMLRPIMISDSSYDALETPAQIREALQAFPQLLKDSPSGQDSDPAIWGLLDRWSRIDPEGFDQSPYSRLSSERQIRNLIRSTDEWQNLSAEQREARAKQLIGESGEQQNCLNITEYSLAATWARIDQQACSNWIATLPDDDRPALATGFAIGRASSDVGQALEALKTAPSLAQKQTLPRVFYAWSSTHPGEMPDMEGWPDLWRQSWTDLETLRKIREKNGVGKNGLTF